MYNYKTEFNSLTINNLTFMYNIIIYLNQLNYVHFIVYTVIIRTSQYKLHFICKNIHTIIQQHAEQIISV